jgi:hypothetical protein
MLQLAGSIRAHFARSRGGTAFYTPLNRGGSTSHFDRSLLFVTTLAAAFGDTA